MLEQSAQPKIMMIGNDPMLVYLLQRYAEQGGCEMILRSFAPMAAEVRRLKLVAIIFSSLEYLHTAELLIEDLSAHEVMVLACVATAEEARAREYGADICLVHPLTFENFWAALSPLSPAKPN